MPFQAIRIHQYIPWIIRSSLLKQTFVFDCFVCLFVFKLVVVNQQGQFILVSCRTAMRRGYFRKLESKRREEDRMKHCYYYVYFSSNVLLIKFYVFTAQWNKIFIFSFVKNNNSTKVICVISHVADFFFLNKICKADHSGVNRSAMLLGKDPWLQNQKPI